MCLSIYNKGKDYIYIYVYVFIYIYIYKKEKEQYYIYLYVSNCLRFASSADPICGLRVGGTSG